VELTALAYIVLSLDHFEIGTGKSTTLESDYMKLTITGLHSPFEQNAPEAKLSADFFDL